MDDFLVSLVGATLRVATPLIFATLGELFCERAGILNLGIEGIMFLGAFVGFTAASLTGSLVARFGRCHHQRHAGGIIVESVCGKAGGEPARFRSGDYLVGYCPILILIQGNFQRKSEPAFSCSFSTTRHFLQSTDLA